MESVGMVNQYVCQSCKKTHHTLNLNDGTTPFMISCKHCPKGSAQSCHYKMPKDVKVEYVWYRPAPDEFKRLPIAEQEHILIGGLIMGKLLEVAPIHDTGECREIIRGGDTERWLVYIAHAYNPSPDMFDKIKQQLER